MPKGYDPACEDLARKFLPKASDANIGKLAQHVQDAVEDWMSAYEEEPDERAAERDGDRRGDEERENA